ncbi:MAG: rane protein [Devosia sp.]|nr:rane protein [Devosia sp.]
MLRAPEEIIAFWFVEHGPDDWFAGKPEFDVKCAEAFGETLERAAKGEAWQWRGTPKGRLAEIIVLDQFSRQLLRGSPRAFAQDGMALTLAQEAAAAGHDLALAPERRTFLYMPYMHSESLVIHDEAMRLFTALGDENTLKFEMAHRDCIMRFGRYPRRNGPLGRETTPEEAAYLMSDAASF